MFRGDRLRNAWRALFARNPTITVEVRDGTWSAKWQHMSADDATVLLHGVSAAMQESALARMDCDRTVH